MTASHTYAKHDPSLLPCSRLRLTIWQMTSEDRFSSVKYAADMTFVRTSIVEREAMSLIKGSSVRVSMARPPSSDQIRSYSCCTSSYVGCGDHSTPTCRR